MKALKFLKHMKQTDTPYNFRECELDEAIAELEEAMKPKTCDGCVHKQRKEHQDANYPCLYCQRCGKDHYEPKDNA